MNAWHELQIYFGWITILVNRKYTVTKHEYVFHFQLLSDIQEEIPDLALVTSY